MSHYVVRKAEGGPDLVWVAEVDFDALDDRGVIRYAGGLEGLTKSIDNAAALEAAFTEWRADGCQIDLIP